MRIALFTIFVFYSVCTFSQTVIKATIKDSRAKEPLSFCNVLVKGTKRGTITNADGVFSISADISKDVLVFSYLGYVTQSIQVGKLLQNPVVLLVKKDFVIQEVTVHAGNDYLYDIMVKCRKNLLKNKAKSVARVYYGLETGSKTLSVEYPGKTGAAQKYTEVDPKEKPVELLECFYNGYLNGIMVEELRFKNGRTALAASENYFLTHNSSKAISMIELIGKNNYFPSIPFQYGKNGLKKHFNIELQYFDGNCYNLKFYPQNNTKDYFAGEVWIEKETFKLLKIHLLAENTPTHPFITIHPSIDSICNVSFDITNTYRSNGDRLLPDHIYFNYSFTYRSRRDTIVLDSLYKNLTREIKTKGIMYFYDYEKPFILPYFDYIEDVFSNGDYFKMSFIPYNETFWNNNNIMLLTEKQKKNFKLLSREGQLINYRGGNYGSNFLKLPIQHNLKIPHFFEFFYAFWSPDKRIIPNTSTPQFETYSIEKINSCIRSDLYNLKVQILLDITESGDSLLCNSYTVFDNAQTYYHLPLDFYKNAFFNIYFDICEIERREMQTKLDSKAHTKAEIDAIYKATIENMDIVTKRYLKEVDLGENNKLFHRWNKYVLENLNIDNIEMVEETIRSKEF